MPKGVEHNTGSNAAGATDAPRSCTMPKGVEHKEGEFPLTTITFRDLPRCRKALSTLAGTVEISGDSHPRSSTMPKGVEHLQTLGNVPGGAARDLPRCRKALSTSTSGASQRIGYAAI